MASSKIKVAIPAASGSASGAGAGAGAARPSVSDLMSRAKQTAAPAAKADKADDRPVFRLSPAMEKVLDSYVEANEISDICEGLVKANAVVLKCECLHLFTDMMWRNRSVPANPKIATYRDADRKFTKNSAIFQLKSIFRPGHVIPKEIDDGKTACDYLFDALTTGEDAIGDDAATLLIETEIKIEKSIGIRDLNHLHEGQFVGSEWQPATDMQRSLVAKVLAVLYADTPDEMLAQGVFTEEERGMLLRQDNEVIRMKDPKGFLNRTFQYAASADQIRHILGVLKPDQAISSVKFAENSPPGKNEKLEAARNILGVD